MNLVEWLKAMVGNGRTEEVVDPNLEVKPTTRALKRALLTALRCVNPDSDKRPKMSQVVQMLEADQFPLQEVVIFLQGNCFLSKSSLVLLSCIVYGGCL